MTDARKKAERLDQLLVQLGLVQDVKKAQALIMAGEVTVASQRVDKPGQKIPLDAPIKLKDRGQYVSRGGDKLAHLIVTLNLKSLFAGAVVLDVGASTGGFTDCALQHGAARITAVDVGQNQLDWKLRADPRVVSFEKTDIRAFTNPNNETFTVVVADISFNSISLLLPAILQAGGRHAQYLLLVKPQFEAPRSAIPEGGVVVDPKIHERVLLEARKGLEQAGLQVLHEIPCGVKGRAGNQEFFVVAVYP